MTEVKADERVRLTKDIPEYGNFRGDWGIVCSTWFDPGTAFEVEFQPRGSTVRTLVTSNQITKESDSSNARPVRIDGRR